MLDILSSYLATATSPEMHAVLRDAHSTMAKISNYDYDGYFTELLMTDGDRDEGETVQAVIEGTQGFLHGLLGEHGVKMMPGTHIELLTKTLRALVEIPTYGNAEELHGLILAGHSSHETFAEIMHVMTTVSTEEYMLATESVSSNLISRVTELVVNKEEETVSEEETLIRSTHILKLKRYSGFIQKEDLRMIHMVKDGMPVGYPFKVYADYIGREFENYPAEKIAHEMYAMALCAVDGMHNPRAVIGAHINNYVSDISTITKVDIIVNDIMVKMNSHG